MVARDLLALHALIDARHAVPHAWGREANDCVGYVLAAVEAQTGMVAAKKLQWADRAKAVKIIKRYGSLEAAFDRFFDRIPASLAQRGDIAGVPDDDFGIHPMIVEGATLVGPGDKGNKRMPRRAMTVAWSAMSAKP